MDTTSEASPESDATTEAGYRPRRTWAGLGTGASCDLCREPISTEQIEYEIVIEDAAGAEAVRLHFDCYDRWASNQM